ncbi:uncharacterized protein LOC142550814 [Primulina tabacum]|uniref:uncharacterized protein LOC142550814 n=1 Tax=Primulina tabacum TaxID=48773 RepID=UPI003F5A6F62
MANTTSPAWNLQMGRSAVDDQSSPYFLHHSDNPGQLLVSQLLTSENFSSWSRAMKIALSVKNKLGFIDGSIHKPPENDLTLTSIQGDISEHLVRRISRRYMEGFAGSISTEQCSKNISTAERIDQFAPRSRSGCCGKCNCNGVKNIDNYVQMDYAMTFLMGLNDSFTHIRSQVLLLDPLPSINKIFALVIQEERQRAIGIQSTFNTPTNNLALALKGEQPQSQQQHSRARIKFQKGRPY